MTYTVKIKHTTLKLKRSTHINFPRDGEIVHLLSISYTTTTTTTATNIPMILLT